MMILDKLTQKNQAMKDLYRLETIQANRQQQELTDARYNALVEKVHAFTKCLYYAQNQLNFRASDEIIDSTKELLLALKEETTTGFVNPENLSGFVNKYRDIQDVVKKEWAKYYVVLVSTTKNTLKVIRGIDAERVETCRQKIDEAAVWSGDKNSLLHLKNALDEAEALIQGLNLDQEIIVFLENMNLGRATVEDLSNTVLAWIQKESLQRKIKLSFSTR